MYLSCVTVRLLLNTKKKKKSQNISKYQESSSRILKLKPAEEWNVLYIGSLSFRVSKPSKFSVYKQLLPLCTGASRNAHAGCAMEPSESAWHWIQAQLWASHASSPAWPVELCTSCSGPACQRTLHSCPTLQPHTPNSTWRQETTRTILQQYNKSHTEQWEAQKRTLQLEHILSILLLVLLNILGA